jgi:4-diphosphocytidyl-2-C-methyl-D-erythritol kinase
LGIGKLSIMTPVQETAYAKINLALHVRRRRADGYHDLETLFAFVDFGDDLWLEDSAEYALVASGEFARNMGAADDNLVTRTARLVHGGTLPALTIHLTKALPVAAGLGGGSADAAAALRLLGAGDRFDLAAALGADVPACLNSVPVIGSGTGTELTAVANDISGLACLIINPLKACPTGPVFAAWDGVDRGALPTGSAQVMMQHGRNDLEAPAIAIVPEIAAVLDYLIASKPLLARMSGSGASCFAIYEDFARAEQLAQKCRKRDHRNWWARAGRLR